MQAVVDRAAAEGIDAIIASDMAVIRYARSRGVEVHASTQLNISNGEALRFYSSFVDVAVLARELTLDQVAAISSAGIVGPSGRPVRIEMFAHGALCMAVSGRCYLSQHDCGESANRGACRQICRRSFTLRDAESGAEIETHGQWLLSPKDLCAIDFLDRMIDAGVSVLKIEGRARPPEYVLRTCRCYDRALRALEAGEYTPALAAALKNELAEVFNRGFWGGYYLGAPTVELSRRYGSSATMRKVYVGKVTNVYKRIPAAEIQVEASPLEQGNPIIFTGATTGVVETVADEIRLDDRPVPVAPQGTLCSVKIAGTVRRGDRLFKLVKA
jgi:putative protease